jgi:hypothetical protein
MTVGGAFLLGAYVSRSRSSIAGVDQDWLRVQYWARDNTDKSALFAAPLQSPDFRVFASRSSVLGVHDGGPAFIDQAYAMERRSRIGLADAYRAHSCAEVQRWSSKFGADYAITDWDCGEWSLASQSGVYRVYKLR